MQKNSHYLVAPVALEEYRRLPVENILQAPLFAQFTPTEEEVFVPVTLASDLIKGSWRVRWEFGIIGEVAKELREEYPEMVRVTASGLHPETLAGIRLEEGQVRVDVLLPPPDLAIPRNNVTEETWVFPPGDAFEVNTATGEFDEGELQVLSPSQWLVVLVEMGEQLIATLDGRVLGTVEGDKGAELLSFVRTVQQEDPGSPVAARLFIQDERATIDASKPHGDCEHVTPLDVPDSRPRSAHQVLQLADDTLMVTVAQALATDPEDDVNPREGARVVVSPHETAGIDEVAPESEEVDSEGVVSESDAPEEMPQEFPEIPEAIPSRYLSYSDQLREMREQKAREAGPRHYRPAEESDS